MTTRTKTIIAGAGLLLALAGPVSAHTETDHVALPAGETGELVLRPTHGCGTSGTIEVTVRAPVEGAIAGEVAGWTATVEADGQGNTVLTWTGGLLPSDTPGAFPIEFEVPDTVGELLVFPAIQICENGDELAWIDGDPESQYPAPRILVLAAGSAPAGSLDQVPPDAPGRDQLVAVVDVDNPSPTTTTTTTTPPQTTTTTEASATDTPATTTPPDTTVPDGTVPDGDDTDAEDLDGSGGGWLVPVLIGAAVAAAAVVVVRRR